MIGRFPHLRRRFSSGGWEYIVNGKYGLLNPIDFVGRAIEVVHINTGLSWAGSIILSSLIARTLILPLGIGQIKSMYATANVKPLMDKQREKMLILKKEGNTEEFLKENKVISKINSDNGISITNSLLSVLITGCSHTAMFFGLRAMIKQPIESFSTDGMFWFSNLLESDTTYILPLASSILMYLQLKISPELTPPNDQTTMMKRMGSVFALGSSIITCHFPSGLLLLMISGNLYNFLFKLAMLSSKLRKYLGVQDLKYPPSNTTGSTIGLPTPVNSFSELKKNITSSIKVMKKDIKKSNTTIPKKCRTVEKSGKVLHFE